MLTALASDAWSEKAVKLPREMASQHSPIFEQIATSKQYTRRLRTKSIRLIDYIKSRKRERSN
jgi:hypothetical protein